MSTSRITIGRSRIYLNGFASNTHMMHTCNKSDYSIHNFSISRNVYFISWIFLDVTMKNDKHPGSATISINRHSA